MIDMPTGTRPRWLSSATSFTFSKETYDHLYNSVHDSAAWKNNASGDRTGNTFRTGSENTAAQLQHLIKGHCSGNVPALLPEKEEKQPPKDDIS